MPPSPKLGRRVPSGMQADFAIIGNIRQVRKMLKENTVSVSTKLRSVWNSITRLSEASEGEKGKIASALDDLSVYLDDQHAAIIKDIQLAKSSISAAAITLRPDKRESSTLTIEMGRNASQALPPGKSPKEGRKKTPEAQVNNKNAETESGGPSKIELKPSSNRTVPTTTRSNASSKVTTPAKKAGLGNKTAKSSQVLATTTLMDTKSGQNKTLSRQDRAKTPPKSKPHTMVESDFCSNESTVGTNVEGSKLSQSWDAKATKAEAMPKNMDPPAVTRPKVAATLPSATREMVSKEATAVEKGVTADVPAALDAIAEAKRKRMALKEAAAAKEAALDEFHRECARLDREQAEAAAAAAAAKLMMNPWSAVAPGTQIWQDRDNNAAAPMCKPVISVTTTESEIDSAANEAWLAGTSNASSQEVSQVEITSVSEVTCDDEPLVDEKLTSSDGELPSLPGDMLDIGDEANMNDHLRSSVEVKRTDRTSSSMRGQNYPGPPPAIPAFPTSAPPP